MKIFRLRREQFLPIEIKEAWSFFSNPHNLSLITPRSLGFTLLEAADRPLVAGLMFRYKISLAFDIKVQWITAITLVNEPFEFMDVQRVGPFSLWKHHHYFIPVEGGVNVVDEVEYSVPFGPVGEFVNWAYVRRAVSDIFTYRAAVLTKRFREKAPFDLVTIVTHSPR